MSIFEQNLFSLSNFKKFLTQDMEAFGKLWCVPEQLTISVIFYIWLSIQQWTAKQRQTFSKRFKSIPITASPSNNDIKQIVENGYPKDDSTRTLSHPTLEDLQVQYLLGPAKLLPKAPPTNCVLPADGKTNWEVMLSHSQVKNWLPSIRQSCWSLPTIFNANSQSQQHQQAVVWMLGF